MLQIVRKITVVLAVTLYTALVLGGPCLHAFPGAGHRGSSCTSEAAGKGSTVTAQARPAHLSADGCPICHFLSQGQLPVAVSSGSVAPVVAVRLAVVASTTTPAWIARPGSPRAPPAISPNAS